MKALNNMKFIATMGIRIEGFFDQIEKAECWADARKIGNMTLGEIDCMTTYLNSMICTENNDFTEELGETLDSWTADLYQRMANKADALGKDSDTVLELLKKRDMYR